MLGSSVRHIPELSSYFAVGKSDACVAKSFDGIFWNTSLQCGVIFNHGTAICYGGGVLVAIGLGGTGGSKSNFAWSMDAGTTWTPSVSPTGTTTFLGNVDFSGCTFSPRLNRFVATGTSINGENAFAVSDDRGQNWIGVALTEPTAIFDRGGRGVIWNDPLFVAVGQTNNTLQSIATSADGIIWTAASNNPLAGNGKDLVFSPKDQVYLAVGDAGGSKIASSLDPSFWTAVADPFSNNVRRITLAPFLNRIYAIGDSTAKVFWTANLGTSWNATILPAGSNSGFGIGARQLWPIDDFSVIPPVVPTRAQIIKNFTWVNSIKFAGGLQVPFAELLLKGGTANQSVDGVTELINSILTVEEGGYFTTGSMVVSGASTLKLLVKTSSSVAGNVSVSVFGVQQTFTGSFSNILAQYAGSGCVPTLGQPVLVAPGGGSGPYAVTLHVDPCTSSSTSTSMTSTPAVRFTCPSSVQGNCSCDGLACTITETYSVGSTTFVVPAGVSIKFTDSWICAPESKVNISVGTVSQGPLLVVVGTAQLSGTLNFLVGSVRNRVGRTVPTAVQVLSAGAVVGQFDSVVATSSDPCTSVSATPVATATTLSVTLSATDTCSGGGLPLGAIIGIAVGASVVGVGLAILVVVLMLRQRKKRESLFVSALAGRASEFAPVGMDEKAEDKRRSVVSSNVYDSQEQIEVL